MSERAASRWVAGGVCLAAAGVLGCSGDERAPPLRDGRAQPVEGCESFSYQTCDILMARCQDELFRLVGCLRGESVAGVEPPPVSLLSQAEVTALFMEQLGEPTAAAPDQDFSAVVRGLELLGLVDPGLISSPADVFDVTLPNVSAFYQPATGAVVIIDRDEPLADLDANAILAHEFVHAWQDRRHDLASFDGDPDLDSDRFLALESVVEGEAMLYQLLLMLAYGGVNLDRVDYAGMFQSLIDQGEQFASMQGSPMVMASGIFPYTYGARYVGEHWLDGGHELLDQLFEQPPGSTLEVMWQGPAASLPRVDALEVIPAPLAGYRFVGDDVAGAWVILRRLLELSGATGDARALRELATRWRGDRFWVYQAEDASLEIAVVWWVDWSDEASAEQFSRLMAGFRPGFAPSGVEVQGTRARVVVSERAAELDAWAQRAGQ